ncbi:MAG: DNA polymerase III subunit delta' [Burkholderiales bacterium]|nr:DNA polymerase III subunit delta' [Burkholderiales bacterium]
MNIDVLPWHDAPLRSLLSRREKLPHALLLYGRQGIGKVVFARALAQSLLCESPQHGLACGACAACGWFTQANHPDFRELMPEALTADEGDTEATSDPDAKEKKKSKEIKVEQIRGIADFMTLSTHRDGFRVLLIHPAETLNANAANSLLKTLEEPPPRTLILLVTDQIGRLLATIKSRCQRVMVPAPDKTTALAWLKTQRVADADADTALGQAGGAPLSALAFADADYQSQRKAFMQVLAATDADHLAAAQSFEKSDLANVVTWLQTWVNDVVRSRLTGEVQYHCDQKSAIARIAARVHLPALFRYESQLRQTRRAVHHPLNARLLREQLLISYTIAITPA